MCRRHADESWWLDSSRSNQRNSGAELGADLLWKAGVVQQQTKNLREKGRPEAGLGAAIVPRSSV